MLTLMWVVGLFWLFFVVRPFKIEVTNPKEERARLERERLARRPKTLKEAMRGAMITAMSVKD